MPTKGLRKRLRFASVCAIMHITIRCALRERAGREGDRTFGDFLALPSTVVVPQIAMGAPAFQGDVIRSQVFRAGARAGAGDEPEPPAALPGGSLANRKVRGLFHPDELPGA